MTQRDGDPSLAHLQLLCRRAALFLVTFALVTRVAIPGLTVGMGHNLLFVFLSLSAFFLVFLAAGLARCWQLPKTHGLLGLSLIFAGLSLACPIWASNREHALLQGLTWASDVLLFITVLLLATHRPWANQLLAALLAVAVVEATYTLYQLFIGLPDTRALVGQTFAPWPTSLYQWFSGLPETPAVAQTQGRQWLEQTGVIAQLDNAHLRTLFEGRLHTDRAFGTFTLPNSLGGYLLLYLPLAFILLAQRIKRGSWKERFGCGMLALLLLVALGCSGSKGAFLALALLAALSMGWRLRRFLGQRRFLLLALFLLSCTLGLSLYGPNLSPLRRLFHQLGQRGETFLMRLGYWRAGTHVFWDHPWLGVGLDNFRFHYYRYRRPWVEESNMAHNSYLQIAVEMGVPGVVVLGGLLWAGWRCRRAQSASCANGSDQEAAPTAKNNSPSGNLLSQCIVPLGSLVAFIALWFWGVSYDALTPGEMALLHWGLALLWFWVWLKGRQIAQSPLVVAGLQWGLLAFLLHNLVDLDWYVHGVSQTAWILLALLVARPETVQTQPMGRLTWRLGLPCLGVILLILGLWAMPRAMEFSQLQGELPGLRYRLQQAQTLAAYREAQQPYRQCLQRALQLNPWNALLHAEEGLFFCQYAYQGTQQPHFHSRQDLEQTLLLGQLALERAVQLSPNSANVHFSRTEGALWEARAWQRLGLPQRVRQARQNALVSAEKNTHCYPANPHAWYVLGKIHEESNEPTAALYAYRQALILYDQYHPIYQEHSLSKEQRQQMIQKLAAAWRRENR